VATLLGAEPPARSRGRAPGQGGFAPPEAESILVTGCPTEPENLAPFPKMHLYFYSRCNGNDMGKICRNPGGQVAPCPFPGAPMALSYDVIGKEHTRADTIGTVPVRWAGHFLC